MASPDLPAPADDSSLFAPLTHLPTMKRGPVNYYAALARSADPMLRLGAISQMLALKVLPYNLYEEAVTLSTHAGIKARAYEFFKDALNFELARQVAATPARNPDRAVSAYMQAEIDSDAAAAVDSFAQAYLDSSQVGDLFRAAQQAEGLGGWKPAAEWYVRAAAIAPLDAAPFNELFRVMGDANQFDRTEELVHMLGRAGLHPYLTKVYGAAVQLGRGDARGALATLNALKAPPEPMPRGIKWARGQALKIASDAQDRLGDYQGSYRNAVAMNQLEVTPAIDPGSAIKNARLFAGMDVPPLAPLVRDDVVMMLGFARSGTTLLEMVLGSHPMVEALEEPMTWDRAVAYLDTGRRSGASARIDRAEFFTRAREIYFEQIELLHRDKSRPIVVDKHPMRSQYARTLKAMLPEQNYIFCIRHPFDVVLSCFKQRFGANAAMENFRTFKGGIELYDFTMSQWFGVHDFEDPHVHYVRYDRLVEDFEETAAGVLRFMGLGWSEDVRDFASVADQRRAVTPSYQKIRKGLSMGVQTYWRNYGFLFDTPEARPLHKWAEFFGYPTRA